MMSDLYGSSILSAGASQYIHPDYLQPLPTTLDAKKSPLALLAQTCSSIGKDSNVPPSKSIIPPIERKESGSLSDKTTPEKSSESNSKRTNTTEKKDGDNKEGSRHREKREDSPKLSTDGRQSTNSNDNEATEEKRHTNLDTPSRSPGSSSPRDNKPIDNSNNAMTDSGCSGMDGISDSRSTKPSKSPSSSTPSATSANSTKTGSSMLPLPPSVSFGSSLFPGYPLVNAHGLPIDPALVSAYTSLGSHPNGLGFPSPLNASALKSSVPPFVSYSRIRTSTGSTLIPVCRDPYCVNCQMSLQNSHLSATCTAAGCTQCAHEKNLLASIYSPSAASLPPTLPPGFPGFNGFAGSSSLANSALLGASMYPYSLLSSPAHGLSPFVCNWVAGSDYCGKRFSTSEELLQHLRTHTSSSSDASLPSHFPFGLMTPSASALAALHAHYSSPDLLSPEANARRSYPLSLSPMSSSVASSRFHPYKPTLPHLPPSSSLPSHPTLAPFYNPYSLYVPRIGAGAP